MLTGRGITLATASVLAWLIGRTLGIGELYAVAVASAAAVGLGVLYVRQTTSAIAARRIVDSDRAVAGGMVGARLELRNDSRVPSPTLLITESLPPTMWATGQSEAGTARFVMDGLGPGRIAHAPYAAEAHGRGRYHLGPLVVKVRDPFGVAERTRRYTSMGEILVYPRIDLLSDQQVRGTHMGSGSSDTRRVFATGDEFYTMREYVRGDDLRLVHWPSTAHRQTLMVRQMEQPWQAHATVYLDTRRDAHTEGPTGTFEQAVSVAASLTYHLANRNYALRVVTDTDTGRSGPQPWEQSLDALAVVEPSANTGLGPSVEATRGGEGLFVGILGVPPGRDDLPSHPDLRALFNVRGFGQRLALVVAPDSGHPRAQQTAALLAGAGWQVSTINQGEALDPVWSQIMQPRSRGTSSAASGVGTGS